MKTKATRSALVLAIVMALPLVAAAQGPNRPAAAARGAGPANQGPLRGGGRLELPPEGATVAQVEQLFDQLVLREARATLPLGPDQFVSFRQRLQILQAVRRRTARERQRLLNELGQLSRGGGPRDEEVLTAKLKAIDEQGEESARLVREAHDAVEAVLSVEQRVRFRVLEQRLEQRKLELMAQARQQARRGGPPPP